MKAWMIVGVMVVVVASAGCKKQCPVPPPCPTCPDGGTEVDGGPAPYDGYAFRLVEKDGKVAMVATSSKGRVVVIPIDPRLRVFSDGKLGTAGELLAFRASSGGCPCALPACWPYCRVADGVLSLDTLAFWGSTDVPAWPPAALAPEGPTPGEGTVDPKQEVPAPAPAPTPAP